MTHSRWQGGRLAGVLATALMLASAVTAFGLARALAAPAVGCENWTGTQPPNPGALQDIIFGVAIQSACDAWAVGFYSANGITQTLTEHWDGSTWTVVPSPDPGSANNELRSVRGTSPSDVWAVGSYGDGNTGKSLILHWDGSHWSQVPSPSLGVADGLNAVAASAPSNVWAVGRMFNDAGVNQTLAIHCC
jgi:hypothetical protein